MRTVGGLSASGYICELCKCVSVCLCIHGGVDTYSDTHSCIENTYILWRNDWIISKNISIIKWSIKFKSPAFKMWIKSKCIAMKIIMKNGCLCCMSH